MVSLVVSKLKIASKVCTWTDLTDEKMVEVLACLKQTGAQYSENTM